MVGEGIVCSAGGAGVAERGRVRGGRDGYYTCLLLPELTSC
jgi:hypothetical protein